MNTVLLGIACSAMAQCISQAQINQHVFDRIRMIRVGTATGTAFALDVNDKQYVVTAKHIVAGLKKEDTIHLNDGQQWKTLDVRVLRCDDPVDIAVLIPGTRLTNAAPLEPSSVGETFIGEEVFFAGYPYGLHFGVGSPLTTHAYPLFKRGILSGATKLTFLGSVFGDLTFIDGHNNPGFSGGPIIVRNRTKADIDYKIVGVISGFRHEMIPVLQPRKIARSEVTAADIATARITEKDGDVFRLVETGTFVQSNTGIIHAFSIRLALDLIRKSEMSANPKSSAGVQR